MLIHNDNSVSSQQYRGGHVYSVVVHVPTNKSLCAYYSVTVMYDHCIVILSIHQSQGWLMVC